MFEIYSETPYRVARENHRARLEKSRALWMIRSVESHTPGMWDHVSLRLGNWLIKLGCGLKSQSVFSQLSRNQA